MRSNGREAKKAARRGALLAVALTLAACSGGGDAGKGAEGGAPPADPAAARTAVAADAANVDCTPPPPAPFNTSGPVEWSQVAAYVGQVTFDREFTSTQTVRLCKGDTAQCGPLTLDIQSVAGTQCLQQDQLRELRMLGLATKVDTSRGTATRLGFGQPNATDSVYLLVQDKVVWALFRNQTGQGQWVPKGHWAYLFSADGQTLDHPQAEWLQQGARPNHAAGARDEQEGKKGQNDEGEKDEEIEPGPEEEAVSYAWMACAGGCCQFHGTGPGHPHPIVRPTRPRKP